MTPEVYITLDRELEKLEKKSKSSSTPLDLDDTRRLEILIRTKKMASESRAPVHTESIPEIEEASDEQLAEWAEGDGES